MQPSQLTYSVHTMHFACRSHRATFSQGCISRRRVCAGALSQCQLPSGLTIWHTSTPAEVLFLFKEQPGYLQHGVQLRPGDTVIDVGANIGLFSMLAAEAVGPGGCVLSAEPGPQTAAALTANLQQHTQWCSQQGKQVGRTVVLPVAVTDGLGGDEAQLTVYQGASGWSTLAPDDSEVVANMQAYLRSLLQQSPSSQSQLQQELPTTTSTDSQGWSIPQRTLVWVARQLARIPVVRGVTDIMSSLYVKLVMLRGAETVVVPTATVSSIIQEHNLRVVGLLKVDVERAELDVLRGIQQHHWPAIQQVTMEVHDIDGRVSHVVSLLRERGFSSVHVEQPGHLAGTDLYNLYAVR